MPGQFGANTGFRKGDQDIISKIQNELAYISYRHRSHAKPKIFKEDSKYRNCNLDHKMRYKARKCPPYSEERLSFHNSMVLNVTPVSQGGMFYLLSSKEPTP